MAETERGFSVARSLDLSWRYAAEQSLRGKVGEAQIVRAAQHVQRQVTHMQAGTSRALHARQ